MDACTHAWTGNTDVKSEIVIQICLGIERVKVLFNDYLTPLKYVESKEKVKMTMSQWKSSGSAILSKKECQLNMVNNWFCVHNITSTKEDPNEATTDIFQTLKGKT